MRPISFNQSGSTYCLNGVVMTKEELDLFLGMNGFFVEGVGNFQHYLKSLSSIRQLPEDELTTSLDFFSTLTVEMKLEAQKYVERKKNITRVVKKLALT